MGKWKKRQPKSSPTTLECYITKIEFPAEEDRKVLQSKVFPEEEEAYCQRFRLRLSQVEDAKMAVELRYWTPLCDNPNTSHTFEFMITGRCGPIGVNLQQEVTLRCHEWTRVCVVPGGLDRDFDFYTQIQVPSSPRIPTFPALWGSPGADIRLESSDGGGCFVHSNVLAAHSAVFRSTRRPHRKVLRIDADTDTITELASFMYHGRAPTERLYSLHDISRTLIMQSLTHCTLAAIMDSLCPVSAPLLFKYAYKARCTILFRAAASYIKDHCDEVIQQGIKELSRSDVQKKTSAPLKSKAKGGNAQLSQYNPVGYVSNYNKNGYKQRYGYNKYGYNCNNNGYGYNINNNHYGYGYNYNNNGYDTQVACGYNIGYVPNDGNNNYEYIQSQCANNVYNAYFGMQQFSYYRGTY